MRLTNLFIYLFIKSKILNSIIQDDASPATSAVHPVDFESWNSLADTKDFVYYDHAFLNKCRKGDPVSVH